MSKKIKGEDLKNLGYREGKILGMALLATQNLKNVKKEEALILLRKVKDYPESFLDDPEMKALAQAMIEEANAPVVTTILSDNVSPLFPSKQTHPHIPFMVQGSSRKVRVARWTLQ